MAKGDAYDGLSNLANSVRRSTAMHIALSMTPPDSTLEDMFEIFDKIAAKIGGNAQAEQEQDASDGESLGVPWNEREQD